MGNLCFTERSLQFSKFAHKPLGNSICPSSLLSLILAPLFFSSPAAPSKCFFSSSLPASSLGTAPSAGGGGWMGRSCPSEQAAARLAARRLGRGAGRSMSERAREAWNRRARAARPAQACGRTRCRRWRRAEWGRGARLVQAREPGSAGARWALGRGRPRAVAAGAARAEPARRAQAAAACARPEVRASGARERAPSGRRRRGQHATQARERWQHTGGTGGVCRRWRGWSSSAMRAKDARGSGMCGWS
jgi:hypothetical protein